MGYKYVEENIKVVSRSIFYPALLLNDLFIDQENANYSAFNVPVAHNIVCEFII